MKNNFFIAVCMTFTIALLFAWTQRWTDGPKQTTKDNDTDIVLQYKKDNWANQSWVVIYGIDGKSSFYGTENPASAEKDPAHIENVRNTLTYSWGGLTLLFLFLSLYGLLNKVYSKDRRKNGSTNNITSSGLKSRL